MWTRMRFVDERSLVRGKACASFGREEFVMKRVKEWPIRCQGCRSLPIYMMEEHQHLSFTN